MSFSPRASKALASPPQSVHKDEVWQLCWLDAAPVPPVQWAISSLPPPRIGPFLPGLPHFMCTRSPTCILSLNAASHTLYAKETALWYFLQVLVSRPHLTSYTKRFVVLKGFFIAGSFTTSPSPLTPVCSAIYFLFYVHIKSDRHWNLKQTSDFQVQECSDF